MPFASFFLLPLVLALIMLADPAGASQFGTILAGPAGGWVLFLCALAGLFLFAALCRQLSRYLTEQTHASRVARVMDTLANQADGIAGMLLSHPPATGATLQIVREAAIAQSLAYVKVSMPTVLGQIGATDGILATRLSNFVSAALTQAAAAPAVADGPAPSDATASGSVLVAGTPQPAALPSA